METGEVKSNTLQNADTPQFRIKGSGVKSIKESYLGCTPRRALPQKYKLPFPNETNMAKKSCSPDLMCGEKFIFTWTSVLKACFASCGLGFPFCSSITNGSGKMGGFQNYQCEKEPPPQITPMLESPGSTRRALLTLLAVFLTSLAALAYVYTMFPELEPDEKPHIKLPRDIEDAKALGRVLSRYTDRYFLEVIGGVFVSYIFLQTFAIPGSISLSILSGYLFPFPVALLLVCFCSATGASFCYLLSFLVGRRIVYKYFPDKAKEWSQTVTRHRSHLLNYIIFLRITPFLPNWFINITSPVIDVPLWPFWLGTFLGVAPPSFVAVQAGTTLQQMTSSSEAVSWGSMGILAIFAVIAVLPVAFKNKLREKFD